MKIKLLVDVLPDAPAHGLTAGRIFEVVDEHDQAAPGEMRYTIETDLGVYYGIFAYEAEEIEEAQAGAPMAQDATPAPGSTQPLIREIKETKVVVSDQRTGYALAEFYFQPGLHGGNYPALQWAGAFINAITQVEPAPLPPTAPPIPPGAVFHGGPGATIEPAPVELTARRLLAALVDAWAPAWFYQMGKTGYECSFCGAMVRTVGDLGEAGHHKAQCPYPAALEFIKTTAQDTTAPDAGAPGDFTIPLLNTLALGLGYDPVERVEWGTSGAQVEPARDAGAQEPIQMIQINPQRVGEVGALFALFQRDYKDSPAPAWLELYQDGSGRVRLSNKTEPEYEFATLEEGIVKLLRGE